MSFPTEFVQPQKGEVQEIGQKLGIPEAESTEEAKRYSQEQKETLEKEPEGKHVKTATTGNKEQKMERSGDPFPLEKEDQEKDDEFRCGHCGNINCKWCNEPVESEKDSDD